MSYIMLAITRIEDSSRSRVEEIFKYQRFQLFSIQSPLHVRHEIYCAASVWIAKSPPQQGHGARRGLVRRAYGGYDVRRKE